MSETWLFILSLSILFPLLTSVVLRQRMLKNYWPLFCLYVLGLLSEVSMMLAIKGQYSWLPSNNLFILADSILIPMQFAVWGFFSYRSVLALFVLPLLGYWIYLHLWVGTLFHFSAYYRVLYSFSILLLSIYSINHLLVHTPQSLTRYPVFIFLSGFLVFYTYQLLYETAYAFTDQLEMRWNILLNRIFALINFACNIVYGIAVCCIPADPVRRWRRL